MENTNTQFKASQQVKVIRTAHAPKERGGIVGRFGTFVEYTSNGYARVLLNSKPWLVHPENLKTV